MSQDLKNSVTPNINAIRFKKMSNHPLIRIEFSSLRNVGTDSEHVRVDFMEKEIGLIENLYAIFAWNCNVYERHEYSDWVGVWKDNYSTLNDMIRRMKKIRSGMASNQYSISFSAIVQKIIIRLTYLANTMLVARNTHKMARLQNIRLEDVNDYSDGEDLLRNIMA